MVQVDGHQLPTIAKGKGPIVRWNLKEAYAKLSVERTWTSSGTDKSAKQDKVQ